MLCPTQADGRPEWGNSQTPVSELVTQAELELTVRGVGLPLGRDLSESTAGRIGAWIVQVRMVGEVECLRPENQLIVFMRRDDGECLLHGNVPALEAWAVDLVSGLAGSKGPGSGLLEDPFIEPVALAGRTCCASLEQLHGSVSDPELVTRPRPDTSKVVTSGNRQG